MMLLDSRDLSRLSRLLGDAMELPPAEVDGWFARLPDEDQSLVPRLREMLAMNHTLGLAGFLMRGPRADLDAIDGIAFTGDRVGPYQLIRAIGSGGMGDVWLAERVDGGLNRQVALKLPRLAWGAGLAERMARERDIGARLEHPHIARLYDAGVDEHGRPYLAFEYIEGQAIDAWCDARRLPVVARLRVFLQVLQAVAYAHGRLVVHRDLKPANVLVAADGQARLLDFGIAKLLEETASADSQLTRQVGHTLTPAYASPEQIRGEPLTVASDIYSLGVLLHELLTGCLPFARKGSSPVPTLDGAQHFEATRPSRLKVEPQVASLRGCDRPGRLASQLAGDLDTIILKALRRSAADRYSSVERFAEDVERYLTFLPITARPPALAHRLRLFERRHRPAISMAGVGTTFAIVLAVLLWQQHARTVSQAARTDAVREFMLDMVEDVEPDESQAGAEVTGRQMLQGSLGRVRERFRDDPRMLGEVLAELDRMLRRLGDEKPDRPLLTEAYDLLLANAPPNDAALNKTRIQLAEMAYRAGRLNEAGSLTSAALAASCTEGAECAKALTYAHSLASMLDQRAGRVASSIEHQRIAAAEAERGFGPRQSETAMTYYSLSVATRNAGRFDEAGQAIARAQEISEQTVLRARDRFNIQSMHALILQDAGHFREARNALAAMQAGKPTRDGRSNLMRLLANTDLLLGDADAALKDADDGLALADPAARSAVVVFTHQARATALGLQGRVDEALVEMQGVSDGLATLGYAPASQNMLRARRLTAEILARGGRLHEADAALDALIALLPAHPEVPVPEVAHTLELKGCVLRESGRSAEAIALHEKARELWLKRLGADHPFVVRNAVYLARARWSGGAAGPERAAFERLAALYMARFDSDSLWVRLLQAQLGGAASPSSAGVAPLIL